MGHADTLIPGALVRCAYRGVHRGAILAKDDPRAWANTLAFPVENPNPAAVSAHVVRCTFSDGKHPVLYPFGVRWDSGLYRIDRLIATGPGQCLETGAVYTVVAVYDGKMDLESAALDTTVAGIQIDDPNLQPYSGAR